MKTKQVLKIDACGKRFSVVYHDGQVNPFCVYRITDVPTEYGYYRQRKTIEVKYADMKSCMIYLTQQF